VPVSSATRVHGVLRSFREAPMAKEYVQQHDGGFWITGTRVSLDSIVYAFLRGSSPESIAQSFPILKLEEVYGAIAYYLAHQEEVDASLRQNDREFETLRAQTKQSNRGLHNKLEEAKQQLHSPQS
jgi:uncharacterized protein (DUF433 family)